MNIYSFFHRHSTGFKGFSPDFSLYFQKRRHTFCTTGEKKLFRKQARSIRLRTRPEQLDRATCWIDRILQPIGSRK